MLLKRPEGFDERCLAELVRLHELEHGRLKDELENAAARTTAETPEARLAARGAGLARREGWAAALQLWQGRGRLLLVLALLLAVLGGVGAALAVAGDGSRPINVVWALGGLLGLHVLMLAVWCIGLCLPGGQPAGFGALWAWLAARMGGNAAMTARAVFGLHRRAGLLRWWLGVATHAVWSVALLGAVLGLVLTFLLRGHVFVWDTTLLPAAFFVRLVDWAGVLPALLGFAVPGAEVVSASGAMPLTDEAARRQWASWLIGCVLFYGVLPRLLLLALCAWRLQAGRRALRLDPALPGFAELMDVLSPASERLGVSDAAPEAIEAARLAAARGLDGRAALAGLELRPEQPWPPALPGNVRDLGVADGREARARVRAALAAEPARRLLMACDARLSPDRGSLAFVTELSAQAAQCRVWLLGAQEAGERLARWQESLAAAGLGGPAVFVEAAAALEWLAGRAGEDEGMRSGSEPVAGRGGE